MATARAGEAGASSCVWRRAGQPPARGGGLALATTRARLRSRRWGWSPELGCGLCALLSPFAGRGRRSSAADDARGVIGDDATVAARVAGPVGW